MVSLRALLPSFSGEPAEDRSPQKQQQQENKNPASASATGETKKNGTKNNKSKSNTKNDQQDAGADAVVPKRGVEGAAEDRYRHDMEQAVEMKRRAALARSPPRTNSNNSDKDAALALQGLDEADSHRLDGKLEAALKLYELSLELALRALRTMDNSNNTSSNANATIIDKGVLEARVHAALSDAETVKSKLQQQSTTKRRNSSGTGKQQPSAESSAESPPPSGSRRSSTGSSSSMTTAAYQSISRALASALQTKPKTPPPPKSAAAAAAAAAAASSRTARTNTPPKLQHHHNPPRQRPRLGASTAPRKTASSPSLSNTNNQTATTAAATTATANPAGDELRRTVLMDFYVDPGDLQRTTWDDVSGLDNVKRSLQETAILPLMRPDLFGGLRKPQNILLYGPPGTGKTLLVRAVAQESQSSLFVATSANLTSKWMGESEKLVRALFAAANEYAPAIVFLDEVDSLLSSRKSDGGEHEASRRLKTEFMVKMDGIIQNSSGGSSGSSEMPVLVLANTNCPWDIDAAILRRFPRRIYVPLPDPAARRGLLENLLKKAGKHSLTARQITTIVKRTDGFSGSDLTALASEASFGPIRSVGGLDAIRTVRAGDVRPIGMDDFVSALSQASKSVTAEHLQRYEEWKERTSTS